MRELRVIIGTIKYMNSRQKILSYRLYEARQTTDRIFEKKKRKE